MKFKLKYILFCLAAALVFKSHSQNTYNICKGDKIILKKFLINGEDIQALALFNSASFQQYHIMFNVLFILDVQSFLCT